jgi:hypothetical protein
MAKIWRNQYFCHRNFADPGVGKLIGDELVQLLAEVLRDPFIAMCGHICTIADVTLRLAICGLAVAGGGALIQTMDAQSLNVYSEFAQIDGSGQVTAPETPREILSPALVRNGFTSFQVVIQAPADKEWWLFVGENPEKVLKVTLYRESKDALEPVELPRKSTGTEVLWLDAWTPADAPIVRIKIEPELYINDDWVTYPMEGRVMQATVTETRSESTVCPLAKSSSPLTRLELRNAAQDFALAAPLKQDERNKLLEWCNRPAPARWSEDYLKIRDYLFRLR